MDIIRKKYIFFTSNIYPIGGTQNYVKSKTKYLKEIGWEVFIFFSGKEEKRDCGFRELNPYRNGGSIFYGILPETIYETLEFNLVMNQILKQIHYYGEENCEYFIESNHDIEALWGELVAKRIHAKHICFVTAEKYREKNQYYEKYIDFFKYKFFRKELAGITKSSMKKFFEGYLDIDVSERFHLIGHFEDNVIDVDGTTLDNIEKQEWNIGYFGRCNKAYFVHMIDGIKEFCLMYPKRKIQFLVIGGDLWEKEENILKTMECIPNLTVHYLGAFDPIPKRIFQLVDVMIASSGCAWIAHRQGVTTIIPDILTEKSLGIFGHTTSEGTEAHLYGEKKYTYVEVLQDVFVSHLYLKKFVDTSWCEIDTRKEYEKFFNFVSLSEQNLEHYDFHYQCVVPLKRTREFELLKKYLEEISEKPEEKYDFVQWIYKQYGNDIGLFGCGMLGELIIFCIPELKFKAIFDNSSTKSIDTYEIERPSKENLQKIKAILISPYYKEEEIRDELIQKDYGGIIIPLSEVVREYLKNKILMHS